MLWIRDVYPGSQILIFTHSGSRIPDLGSRIPTPYFLELSNKFLGKKFYNSLKIGPNFFLQHLTNKIIFNFVKFVATKKLKKVWQQFFFTPFFCCCFWIRDPEWVKIRIRDTGSGINIPYPQHCSKGSVWVSIWKVPVPYPYIVTAGSLYHSIANQKK